MNAENIKIECEEDGFYLHAYVDEGDGVYLHVAYRIEDPEALYDRVKAAIGPWLREREEAFAEFKNTRHQFLVDEVAHERMTGQHVFECDPDESGGYDVSDPKHPDYHSVHADIWDNREGK